MAEKIRDADVRLSNDLKDHKAIRHAEIAATVAPSVETAPYKWFSPLPSRVDAEPSLFGISTITSHTAFSSSRTVRRQI